MKTVNEFQGEHRWLSNFWPVKIEYQGLVYPTVEHAYQAAKTNSPGLRQKIQAIPVNEPGKAKRIGKRLVIDQDIWETTKERVMLQLLREKFKDPVLRAKLLATGNAQLEEGNNWGDTYWGVCLGKGKNRLGILLMQVREELRFECTSNVETKKK